MRAPLLVFVLALVGCPGFGQQSRPSTLVEVVDHPTWDGEVEAIVVAYCTECHTSPAINGAPGYFRLDVYDDEGDLSGAASMAARIVSRADAGTMPPGGGGPSEAEIATLEAWVEDGAPETAVDSGGADVE